MIKTEDFGERHINGVLKIARLNYQEECDAVPELPREVDLPELSAFAENGLGVAAVENGETVGFLCCYKPWEHAFNSAAVGTFSPVHAHGAIKENRAMIWKRLYQAAAEKWVKNEILYHAIALYAHDNEAKNALFSYGFGLRCIDAIRPMETIFATAPDGIGYAEISKENVSLIREMRRSLSGHLGESPCFMYSLPEAFQRWINRAETRDSRVFAAFSGEKPVAFIEVIDEGENFTTEVADTRNICGAFCLPEFRGKGITQGLLNHIIKTLKTEGYRTLGVDFESFNPTASGFWLKYFTAYTNSVVRRIDECALDGHKLGG